jgi:hypothetical protein
MASLYCETLQTRNDCDALGAASRCCVRRKHMVLCLAVGAAAMQMSRRRQMRRVSALLFGVMVASCWGGETYVEVVRSVDDIEVGAYLITHHYITEQLSMST